MRSVQERYPQPERELRSGWITGASSGIGEALARRLAGGGEWHLALSARNAERLEALAAEQPTRLAAHPVDVTDEAAVAAVVERIEARHGPLELAFLNAGDYQPMAAEHFDAALFRRLMEVNYLGVVHAVAALLPRMLERGRGQIVINASVAGYRGLPLAGPYGATKAALINLAETLHAELAPRGVNVRVVNPGFVRTSLTDRNEFRMPAIITPEEAARRIARELPERHFEITFPKRFTYVVKMMRSLPYWLWFPLVRRMTAR